MARIISLDEVDSKLRNHLLATLRVSDEAVVLPQAHRSPESKAVKNVVMRLSGPEEGLNPEVFSPNWFAGVSLVQIPNEKAESITNSSSKRASMLAALVAAIPSEMQDSQLQVGPDIEGDEQDRDTKDWVAGFDSPGCCVGLYSAMQSRSPDSHQTGMSRVHKTYYLVCKAGAGVAGQTFHARLTSALKEGATLDEALSDEGVPGARALRRVAVAAKRNRGRILTMAAEALGFYGIDTIGDNASPVGTPYRLAIPQIDVCYNSLAKVDTGSAVRSTWQYASGCVDAAVSPGMVTSSNVAEGFVAFTTHSGEPRIHLRNEAHCCLPFCTPRIMSNRDAVFKAVDAHKAAKRSGIAAHPDHDWTVQRFGWNSKTFGDGASRVDVEPPCIWGSHESESFLAEWSRELGVSRASPIRLQPEIVAISAVEPGKLRVAVKAIASKS